MQAGSAPKPEGSQVPHAGPPPVAAPTNPAVVGAILAVQLALLVVAAIRNAHALNPDAIAYLRLASYYAHGQRDLMISGYWGPMVSWLIAPMLMAGVPDLVAARAVMCLSGLAFGLGAWVLLQRVGLPRSHVEIGLIVAGLASVEWSVENVSPDLLLTALLCAAVGTMCSTRWAQNTAHGILAGVLFGLAYLTKAVAFPLAVAIPLGFAVLQWLGLPRYRHHIWRSLAATWLVFFLIATPWICALSFKYHHPTFSTTARIAHAVAGPPDQDRYHPTMNTIHHPRPGRLTSWEDPSEMTYRDWSPFANSSNARYQITLIIRNLQTILGITAGFDLLRLAWVALPACVWALFRARRTRIQGCWLWLLWPMLCMVGVYVPVFVQATDERYFYPVYVLVMAVIAGLLASLAPALSKVYAWLPRATGWTVFISFFVPALLGATVSVAGGTRSGDAFAFDLASRIQQAKVGGPIVGPGLVYGERVGLYVAYLVGEQWYGDQMGATVLDYAASGARLVMVRRGSPVSDDLARDERFQDLDDALFGSGSQAQTVPIKVFGRGR